MTELYKLRDDYKNLLAMDLDEQTLADTMESLTDEFDTKAENICFVLKDMGGTVDVLDAEIERLTNRKKTINNRIDGLKKYLADNMEALNKKKIERDLLTITLVAGRQVAEVLDEASLPRKYLVEKTSVSIDRKSLLDDLKSGEVPGATISTSKPSLRIY